MHICASLLIMFSVGLSTSEAILMGRRTYEFSKKLFPISVLRRNRKEKTSCQL
jgi:hypothetical protein